MATGSTGPANDYSRAINEEIRSLMARRGFSQTRLSEETGISQSRLSKTVFRGVAPINTNELDAICEAMDADPVVIMATAYESLKLSAGPRKKDYAKAAKKEQGKEQDAREEDYL